MAIIFVFFVVLRVIIIITIIIIQCKEGGMTEIDHHKQSALKR